MNEPQDNLKIGEAKPEDVETGAYLMYLAFDEFSHALFGTTDEKKVLEYFKKLWLMHHNRMSSRFSNLMRDGEKAVGLIACSNDDFINQMFLPSFGEILEADHGLLKYLLMHPIYLYTFLTNPEADKDEFYIFVLAVLPEYQNKGIGTKLLNFAEQKAKEQNFKKLSLLVRIKNTNGIKFYEHYGFKKVKTYNKKPMDFYKMVKEI